MKILFVLLMSVAFMGCSSSGKKEAKMAKKEAEMAKKEAEMAKKEAMADTKETAKAVVSKAASCSVRSSRRMINFGSPKVTSRAFRRLRLKSSSDFTITNVSSISKPFGYYNSGEFPGEATYHDYNLCDMSTSSNDCSINLEFRPRAV